MAKVLIEQPGWQEPMRVALVEFVSVPLRMACCLGCPDGYWYATYA
jgi:hypothetical protein